MTEADPLAMMYALCQAKKEANLHIAFGSQKYA